MSGVAARRANPFAGLAGWVRILAGRVYWPLAVVVVAGVALRLAATAIVRPSSLDWIDGIRFTRIYPTGFFDDFWMPAGYPAFLSVVHAVSSNLMVTTAVQHAVGVGSAILAFVIVRRFDGPRWLALVPATVLLLSADEVYLEHILMAEFLLVFAVLVALYAVSRSLDGPRDKAWLIAAGVLVALAALVRSPALALIVVVSVWLLVFVPGGINKRLLSVALFVVPAILTVVGYSTIALATGKYTGLYEMSGWDLYPRVAHFADCTRFTPPPGTESLCQRDTPPVQRPGPLYYAWDPTSVSRTVFPLTPDSSSKLGDFARQAIIHQPLSYAKAVVIDLVRYVDPTFAVGDRPWSGESAEQVSFSDRQPDLEQKLGELYAVKYTGTQPSIGGGEGLLQAYGRWARITGPMLLLFFLLAVTGACFGRGRLRQGTVLLGLSSLALYVVPVMTFTYDYRYGLPPLALMVVAGSLGGWSAALRVSAGIRTVQTTRSIAAPRAVDAAARGTED